MRRVLLLSQTCKVCGATEPSFLDLEGAEMRPDQASVKALIRWRQARQRQNGFALVLVIWGVGLISLLLVSVMTAARYRIIAANSVAESAKAEALAAAGVNLTRLWLREKSRDFGRSLLCAMPGGAAAALEVEDEGGKVDLNTAPPKLLALLLRGFGVELDEADRLAAAIAEFARPSTSRVADQPTFQAYMADGRTYGPKKAPFETTLELDQVTGMRTDLFRAIHPYVTVHSGRRGINPRVASPVLLASISGMDVQTVLDLSRTPSTFRERENFRWIPEEFLAVSSGRSFLIHAEVRTAAGGAYAQEAIIELIGDGMPDVLHEWRRGTLRLMTILEKAMGNSAGSTSLPSCLDQ
jgi:general secretion pathway protein K